MTVTYLKKSSVDTEAANADVADRVSELLAELRAGRETKASELAATFDEWQGPIVVERATIDQAYAQLDRALIDDIREAHRNIEAFARAQRASLQPFEIEVSPGLRAGPRLVPVNVSGCYVPAGRFAHIASALMSITTSRVAGVETVVVTSPATKARGGVHPAILAAADIAGADIVLGLGGVQAIAALAFGLFTDNR